MSIVPPALPITPMTSPSWQRLVWRALALALLCGLLHAALPRYPLAGLSLVPLDMVLGVALAAVLARGLATLPAALVGMAVADLWAGMAWPTVMGQALVLALQVWLAWALLRPDVAPHRLQLDSGPALRRLVLLAAPLAALAGALLVLALGLAWAPEAMSARALLAAGLGRAVSAWAGMVVVAPMLLCWLAPEQQAWRGRRRLVALPLLLLLAVLLPGLDELARRDERRQQTGFERDAGARQGRLKQMLGDPVDALLALHGVLVVAGPNPPIALFDRLATVWAERSPGLRSVGWLDAGTSPGELLLGHATALAAQGGAADVPATDRGQLTLAARRLAARTLPAAQPMAEPVAGQDGQLLLMQSVRGPESGQPARWAFVLLDLPRQLAAALPDDDDLNLRLCVFDGGPGSLTAPGRLAGATACASGAAGAVRVVSGRLQLADRRLDLLVIEPASADNRLFSAVWLLALPAVVGAGVLATLLLALTGRLARIEERVRERTQALQAQVDERHLAEIAQAHSEQRFRAMFDAVNIGVTLVDPQGTLLMANPAFCTMMACRASDLLGRPLADIRVPDVSADDGMAQALGGVDARRQRYLTKDGQVLQVAASLRKLVDGSGQPAGTVAALHDLTPMLRLREAEREREEAEIASRTKTEFLSRLGDELRVPLNAIVGFAQMLASHRGAEGGPRTTKADSLVQQQGLAQIRQAGWQLLDMVSDVLDLSRLEAGTLKLALRPVALAEPVQQALEMLAPALQQAGVTVELSLSPLVQWVQADPQRLRQVLLNLLGNAVKYNRPQGRILVRSRPDGLGEVVLEVQDTGMGLSPAQISELFVPFHRLGRNETDARQRGTGIGLVISRRLVALMNGELDVSSRVGEGSVFSLRLHRPAREPEAGQGPTAVPQGQSRSLGQQPAVGRLLCIDADPATAAQLRGLLASRPGVSLALAHTAAQGMAQVADADLVVLALDLPDQPGLALLHALKADTRLRHAPVVVVSSDDRAATIDACFDAGAAQVLAKPLDAAALLRMVDATLAD